MDIQLFGETGLIGGRRGPDGRPLAIPLGTVRAPRGAEGALAVAETALTGNGTLALRGPMVPRHVFPRGAQQSGLPCFAPAADGFVDTGCACEVSGDLLSVSGPPAGLVSFGGYRFAVRELSGIVSGFDGTLAVLPDALAGHRLSGSAANHQAIRAALRGIGTNPLVVEAFAAPAAR